MDRTVIVLLPTVVICMALALLAGCGGGGGGSGAGAASGSAGSSGSGGGAPPPPAGAPPAPIGPGPQAQPAQRSNVTIMHIEPAVFLGLEETPFTIHGEGFQPVGANVHVTFEARGVTPFDKGTRKSVAVEATITSGTRIQGVSPLAMGRSGFQADVTVKLGNVAAPVAVPGPVQFVFPFVDEVNPDEVSGAFGAPVTLFGNNLGTSGDTVTLRFLAGGGTAFNLPGGGRAGYLDVPGKVVVDSLIEAEIGTDAAAEVTFASVQVYFHRWRAWIDVAGKAVRFSRPTVTRLDVGQAPDLHDAPLKTLHPSPCAIRGAAWDAVLGEPIEVTWEADTPMFGAGTPQLTAVSGGDVKADLGSGGQFLQTECPTLTDICPLPSAVVRVTGIRLLRLGLTFPVRIEHEVVHDGRVPDVEAAFEGMTHHGEALGFMMGAGAPMPSITHHWQGMARKPGPGTPFFFLSRSGARTLPLVPGEGTTPGNLVVVRMDSRRTDGERLGSNRLGRGVNTEDKAPPRGDRIVLNIPLDGSRWPKRNVGGGISNEPLPGSAHPGGLCILEDVLAVPLEQPIDGTPSFEGMVQLFDVADPLHPVQLATQAFRHTASAVALHRLFSGHVLMAVAIGPDIDRLEIYRSDRADLKDPDLTWDRFATWDPAAHGEARDRWPTGKGGYQSITFVPQADGALYLVGLCKILEGFDWPDYMDLWQVQVIESTSSFELAPRRRRQLHTESDGMGQIASFAAAGTAYVSPSGELIIYGAEHDNAGPEIDGEGTVRMGEFRHRDMNRCGRVLDAAHAWATLYEDPRGWTDQDESLSIVYEARVDVLDDWNDFRKIDEFNDDASAVRWCAPLGTEIVLYDDDNHQGRHLILHGTGRVAVIEDLQYVGSVPESLVTIVDEHGQVVTGTDRAGYDFDDALTSILVR